MCDPPQPWATPLAGWGPYAPTGLSAAFSTTVFASGAMGQGEVRMIQVILEGPVRIAVAGRLHTMNLRKSPSRPDAVLRSARRRPAAP